MQALAVNLGITFALRMTLTNLIAWIMPWYSTRQRRIFEVDPFSFPRSLLFTQSSFPLNPLVFTTPFLSSLLSLPLLRTKTRDLVHYQMQKKSSLKVALFVAFFIQYLRVHILLTTTSQLSPPPFSTLFTPFLTMSFIQTTLLRLHRTSQNHSTTSMDFFSYILMRPRFLVIQYYSQLPCHPHHSLRLSTNIMVFDLMLIRCC